MRTGRCKHFESSGMLKDTCLVKKPVPLIAKGSLQKQAEEKLRFTYNMAMQHYLLFQILLTEFYQG